MSTITFGKGKTYGWSSTYWSSRTNLQHSNIAATTDTNGWLLLDQPSPTTEQLFNNLTGWSILNSTTEISPAGQVRRAPSTYTGFYKASWMNGGSADNTWSASTLVKIDVPGVYTLENGNGSGSSWAIYDGTRTSFVQIRSDGSNFTVWALQSGTTWRKIATGPVVDTNWHLITIFNNNSANNTGVMIDGTIITTTCYTYAYGGETGKLEALAYKATGDGSVEDHQDFFRYYNTITSFNTSDGVLESDSTSALFDAGAYNAFSQIDWTAVTDNSTAITFQVKTASTQAGLAAASYFSVTSGVAFSQLNQKRFIQVKGTFADASSGLYTPILKDLTLTYGADPNIEHKLKVGGFTVLEISAGDLCTRVLEQTGDWADPPARAISGRTVLVYNSTQNAYRLYSYINNGWRYINYT